MLDFEQCPENVHFYFLPNSEFYLSSYGNCHPRRIFHSFNNYFLRTHSTRQGGYTPTQER